VSLRGRRYHIHEALGRGGFGTVYRAELKGESGFSKAVALKVLNPELEHVDEIARRFRDEARVLGLVRHRAIVHVDGLSRLTASDGTVRWAVVMELIEGCHIGALLRDGPLPPRVATEITGEVAAALHAAWHRKNTRGQPLRLLHRDIKPGNIQLTAEGEVKVLDFGIARADFAHREAQTRSVIFGTRGYMSPERMAMAISPEEGEEGPEGDIYSLGVVLHEMLTSQRFEGNPLQPEDHAQRVHDAQDAVYSLLGEESEALVRLLGRMLDFNPTMRPSARELMRTCSALRGTLGAESLLDWAEEAVPAARAAGSGPVSGAMTGETLLEEHGESADVTGLSAPESPPVEPPRAELPPMEPPTTEPKKPPMWPFMLLGAVLALLLGGGLVSALVVMLEPGDAGSTPTEPVPEEAALVEEPAAAEPASELAVAGPTAAPAEAPSPSAQTAPQPTARSTAKPTTAPTATSMEAEPEAEPASQPAPVVEPAVEAAEAAPSGGIIHVTGSATDVVFVSSTGRAHSPGQLPAGTYTIKADFGAGQVVAGSVTLLEGQQRRFSCAVEFTLCREL
jgi:serine/threonine protein kinase